MFYFSTIENNKKKRRKSVYVKESREKECCFYLYATNGHVDNHSTMFVPFL
jgi:hypothetical protein